jgi:hypothetical protein
VHAVLRFLVGHQVQIGMRERSGPGKGEVAWRAPHQQGLVNMLQPGLCRDLRLRAQPH